MPSSRASLERPHARRTSSATIAVVVLLALFSSLPVHADTKSELANAKKRLGQLEREIDQADSERQTLQARADAISAQLAATHFAIDETEVRINQTLTGIRRRESRLTYLQNRLGARARDAYVKGPGGIFEVIFGSSSFGDLTDRLALYDAVQQSDADLATSIETERVQLEGRKADLDSLKAELTQQQQIQEAQLGEQTRALEAMRGLLDRLDRKRAEAQSLVRTLTKKFAAEKAAIALARKLAGGGGPVYGTGVFRVCPVGAPNAFSDDFGAPRVGHVHAGNDIFASSGTRIYAPFDGTASNASNSLGGLSVYVHGSAGYVYNAHLSAFGTLGPVKAGTVIGYVGNTGNARYTASHDHFEWHPYNLSTSHTSPYGYSVVGSAIDPYPYLVAACR